MLAVCAGREATDFAARTDLRQQELEALQQAIDIIGDGAVRAGRQRQGQQGVCGALQQAFGIIGDGDYFSPTTFDIVFASPCPPTPCGRPESPDLPYLVSFSTNPPRPPRSHPEPVMSYLVSHDSPRPPPRT